MKKLIVGVPADLLAVLRKYGLPETAEAFVLEGAFDSFLKLTVTYALPEPPPDGE